MLTAILFLVFIYAIFIVFVVIPLILQLVHEFNQKRANRFAHAMDRTLESKNIALVSRFYMIAPFVCAATGFVLAPENSFRLPGLLLGFALGMFLPKYYAGFILKKRRAMFEGQIIDALMIMTSSFRGGLSLVQSMEAVVEEMPDPARHEFEIVLGENKMGVALEEALARFYKRMPSPAMQQCVCAILLSRETGGNLPAIFTRIIASVRERHKIEENLRVLTMQGKLQAIVMSGLPVGFFFMVKSTNPGYFKVMLTTDLGRVLMVTAVVLWLLGTFLIIKISTFDDI